LNTLLSKGMLLSATMEPRLFDLDLQLLTDAFLMMIAVFVLFMALSYFLFNPARKLLQGRRDRIQNELETAASDMASAEQLKVDYQAKVANINKEAEDILGDARKKALASENKIIQEAKAESSNIIDRARVEAELEKQKVADEVKTEMITIASLMAGKVVATSINTTIQDVLVNETLKEIGEGTWLS